MPGADWYLRSSLLFLQAGNRQCREGWLGVAPFSSDFCFSQNKFRSVLLARSRWYSSWLCQLLTSLSGVWGVLPHLHTGSFISPLKTQFTSFPPKGLLLASHWEVYPQQRRTQKYWELHIWLVKPEFCTLWKQQTFFSVWQWRVRPGLTQKKQIFFPDGPDILAQFRIALPKS